MGLSKATKGKITEGWQKKPCVKCESPEHTAAACTVPATAKEAWKAAGQFDANDKKHAERLLQTLKNPAGPPPKPTQAPKGSPKQQSGQSTMQSTTSSQPSTGRPLAWNLGMTNAQQQQTAIPPQTQPVFESNKLQMKGYKYQNYERQFPLEDPVRSRPLVAGPVYDFGGKINEVKTTAEEKQGQALTVVANYLEVKKVPEILYEYSVSCAQDVQVEGQNIKERKINKIAELRRIFHALTVQLNLKDRHDWATNFSNIWCKSPIQLCGSYSTEPGASESFNALNYRKQNGEMKTLKRIDVMLVRSIEPKYLASHDPFDTSFVPKNNDAEQHPSVIATALNAIISRKICDVDESRITQVGANKFFVNNGYSPMTSLYAKRGYFTSIRPGSGNRTLLNVNTATSAFFKPTSVTDFERVLEHEEGRPKHYSRRQIERLLRGKVLRIAYERPHLAGKPDPNLEHHRLKVFQDFGQSPPNQIFTKQTKETKKTKEIKETEETKEQMSVQAWYRECGIELKYPQWPCVNVGIPGAKNSETGGLWIPGELLEIVPNQFVSKTLSKTHTAEMMKHALRKPFENVNYILNEGLYFLGISPDRANLEGVGLEIDPKLIQIPARILPPPSVMYLDFKDPRNAKTTMKHTNGTASWDLRFTKFRTSTDHLGPLEVFAINIETVSQTAYDGLLARMQEHGVKVSSFSRDGWINYCPNVDLRSPSVRKEDMERIHKFMTHISRNGRNVSLLVVLPQEHQGIYGVIKRIAETVHGIRVVCCVNSKFDRPRNDQYFSNLALKFNIKGRGINHTLRNEFSLLMGGANRALDTIVLGADVSHPPGNGPDGSPSIAAVVGSVDEHFMTYLGSMRLQAGRTEIISDMKDMVEERLLAWKAKNKVLPKRILFYRDGVSEGQYLEVISKEINAVTKAYQAAAGTDAAKPIITFLIVGKRHHTRFYPNQLEGTVDSTSRNPPRESNGNPRPGLVVDQVVTQPGKHNFYLQAHAAIKGTARPAHYQVLQNDMGLAHAQLQSLTHSLCYALGRATKGISYAAPAYLAHLLCDRGRAYLREWNENGIAKIKKREWLKKRGEEDDQSHEVYMREASEALSQSADWNPWYGEDSSHKNPWHKRLDDIMFWI